MFVRLVSHEIRTPLNIVVMGLKLIEKEMMKMSCDTSLLETVADSRMSCDTAVDLLNDLLAYEKLEAGIMVLERTELRAWDFLRDAARPFTVQVHMHAIYFNLSLYFTIHAMWLYFRMTP